MAAQRRVAAGPSQTVSIHDWIRVPLPGNPSAARMQINNTISDAFIDRVRVDGGWSTMAALRCPNLRSGEYEVKVYGEFPPITTTIAVL